jgi:Cu+-exporting ATPase
MKNEKDSLQVTGMTCTACASAVERSVNKIDGTNNVNVNFATEKLNVEYDPNLVSRDEIIESVRSAGYDVALQDTEIDDYVEENQARHERETKVLWRKF